MSLLRFTRTSQPQQPVPIDWSNPITRGLQECVTPQSLLTNVNGATKVATLTGAGLKGNGTSSYFWRPYTGAKITTAGTIFCIVNGATASADARIFSLGSSANATPIIALQSSGSSAIRGGAFNRAGGQNTLDSDITAFESGVPHTLASTFGGGLNKLFQDGIFRQSVATTNDFSSYTLDRVAVGCLLRSTAGSFNSSAMLLGLIWNRALSDAEIKSLSDNPWQIFQPTNRAIYPETDASPDITLALTGEDVVAAQGSAAPVITVPLTGVATAVAQGTLTVAGNSDITLPLTGLATVADQGSLLASASIPLTGQATVAARGTLSPETSKELTGQAVALAQGNVSPQASVALTGQAVVAAQGVLVAPGDVTVALTGQGVSLATGLMVGSVTPDAGDAKSGVNRLWLIEYYTKEFAKKEATQVVALEGLTAAAKRKAVKKATVAREAAVEKLVAKAESDLEVLTQGIADIGAAQRFTQALIQQVARKPEPEADFMQVANDYRKRMQQEDDELLLFAMVI